MLHHLKTHRLAWLITAVYGTIFCLISLVNHYNFRTFGLDLGIYTHGIYCYSHLQFHNFTMGLEGIEINHLGNHFSPIIALISPLYHLFGTYTLLLVQIAAILFGGWGVYQFAKERLKGVEPALMMVLFFSIWGIYSALGYDFHANVVAAMFVPWFILFYERGDVRRAILMFVLVIICKENMAVWMAAIVAGLAVRDLLLKRKGANWLLTGGLFLAAVAYFGVVQMVIMPALNPHGISNHLGNYSHLGSNPKEVIETMLTQPRHIFYLLFESLREDQYSFKLKTQLHFMVLMSGGIALIYRPHYLIMLAPIYAQKMLSSNMAHWGIYDQYSIEFAPIIALAFTEWMQHLQLKQLKLPLMVFTIATATVFNWHPTGPNTGFYRPSHYEAGLNVSAINDMLNTIPDDAIVSASNVLAPHLAGRDRIYLYPVVKDAEYIVLLTQGRDPYPFLPADYPDHLKELRDSGKYEVVQEAHDLLILRTKAGPSPETP